MESESSEENITERVIPLGNIQLMFHYRDPFIVMKPDNNNARQPRSLISGLTDTFSDVSTNGKTGVAFVSFHPAGACHFFHFSLAEIANRSIDLSELYGREIKQMEEQLYAASSISEKVILLENFLIRHFNPIPAYDNLMIQKGLEMICNFKKTNAKLLSDSLSLEPKTLERKFSRYLGKTTKQVIKLMRFQTVLQDFSINNNINLTELAYRNGYFDQSHFIHEFKSFSGYTPKEFIRKFPGFRSNPEAC